MNNLDPRTRSRLRQADRVANNNKRAAAEQLYRELLSDAPELVEAWVGLSRVVTDPDEKRLALKQALSLDPGHKAARQALDGLATSDAKADDEGEVADVFLETRSYADEVLGNKPREADIGPKRKPNGDNRENRDPVAQAELMPEHLDAGSGEVLVCVNHPGRETGLRCNKCGKPVCSSCVTLTPVGYRCKECIREHEDTFFDAKYVHYLLAGIVALPLSLLAGWFAPLLGFWVIFLGAAVGNIIGRLTFLAIGRRRGRYLPYVVGFMVVVGALLAALFGPSRLLWAGVYAFVATSAAVYQMR